MVWLFLCVELCVCLCVWLFLCVRFVCDVLWCCMVCLVLCDLCCVCVCVFDCVRCMKWIARCCVVFRVLLFVLCLCVFPSDHVKYVFVCVGDSMCDVVSHVLCACV